MTDDELLEIERAAVRQAMDIAHARDGYATNMSRESIVAALRAVFNAGRAQALEEQKQKEDPAHPITAVNPYRVSPEGTT